MTKKLIDTKTLFLFDFDGTLVDTSKDIQNSVNFTRKHFGLEPLSFPEVNEFIGAGRDHLISGAITSNTKIPLAEARKIFINNYKNHDEQLVDFYPEVLETLQQLSDKGKTLGIVSNKNSNSIKDILKHLNCPIKFKVIFGEDNVPDKKPTAIPILEAQKITGHTKEQTVMVGDTIYDIQAGNNAQVTSIAVTYGFGSKDSLAKENPTMFIDNLPEILD